MVDPIKRALTCRHFERGNLVLEEPDQTLVFLVKFGIGLSVCFSMIEISSMAFLHVWNSEVFSAITGLVGVIAGVFAGRKG